MIVVADTSPINYLILISEISILERMYQQVVLPRAVYAELVRPAAPDRVRTWMEQPPAWIEVRTPSRTSDRALDLLDPGERDAILLAEELQPAQLIIDDWEGRQEAQRRGLKVAGTLGTLQEAAKLGLVDLQGAIKRLQGTSFFISPELLSRILNEQA